MRVGHHVTYVLYMSSFDRNWKVLTTFSKKPNMKLHQNLPGGRHSDECGQTCDKRSCLYKCGQTCDERSCLYKCGQTHDKLSCLYKCGQTSDKWSCLYKCGDT
jgi:hypothetical protein